MKKGIRGRPALQREITAVDARCASAENSTAGTTQNDHIDANTGQLCRLPGVVCSLKKQGEIYKIPIFEREVLKLKIAPNL